MKVFRVLVGLVFLWNLRGCELPRVKVTIINSVHTGTYICEEAWWEGHYLRLSRCGAKGVTTQYYTFRLERSQVTIETIDE